MALAAGRSKIIKPNGESPDDFEKTISQALFDLEMNSDLKSHLRELYITAAKEVEVGQGKKAIVIFVPVPQLKAFQKIQTRLVRELEKKFSGKHVVFIAQRRILPKPTRKVNKQKQKRPRSRTLVAVHSAILDDLVYPAEIVGKRIRFRLDGSRLFKVHLDKNQQTNIEHKVSSFLFCKCIEIWIELSAYVFVLFSDRHFWCRLQEVNRQGGYLRIPWALLVIAMSVL